VVEDTSRRIRETICNCKFSKVNAHDSAEVQRSPISTSRGIRWGLDKAHSPGNVAETGHPKWLCFHVWRPRSLWSDYLHPASGFQENERVHRGAGAEISGRFYWSKQITRQDSRRGKWTLPPVERSDLWVQGWGMGGIVGSRIWTQMFLCWSGSKRLASWANTSQASRREPSFQLVLSFDQ